MHSVPQRTPRPIAWLLPWGTLFFACGILLGRSLMDWLICLLALALTLAALLLSPQPRRHRVLPAFLLTVGVLAGSVAYHPAMPAEGNYVISGTVIQAPVLSPEGQVQTLLADVTLDGEAASTAYWTFYLEEEEAPPDWLIPGTRLEMTASVYHPAGKVNPGGFNFKEYLLQRGIRYGIYGSNSLTPLPGYTLQGRLADFRNRLTLGLHSAMGREAGAYAAAMLLGVRDFIPEDDRAAFTQLGIAHILSISGYHVALLAVMMRLLLRPLPLNRKARVGLEAALLLGYSILAGGSAPVIRAAMLLLWREFTRMRHKQGLPLHLLCVTALLQLIFNPTLLTSPSFQLTYGAMLGLTLVTPRLLRLKACRTRGGQRLWEAFCAALAAQIGILFPQLYWFGQLPLFSILLNMALIPLFSGLILLYWATLLLLPIPGVRSMVGSISTEATAGLLAVIRWLASLDLAALWTRQADIITFIGWLLLLFGLSSLLPRRWEPRRRNLLLTGLLLIVLILLPLPQSSMTYTQFSVGDADAAILQDRDVTVVIDTGEDGQAIAAYLHQQRQTVEALIITHLHIDHGGGLRALLDEGIPVEVCYLPHAAETPMIDEEVLPLLEELAATGTEIRYLSRGDVIPVPSGQLTVLWPEKGRVLPLHDANDVNLVLYAEIAGVTMLLTADLPGPYEGYSAHPADILKVAHHGSRDSTSDAFLAAVSPQVLLQSNRMESREERMAEVAGEIPLYATEQDGGIIIRFLGDGKFMVETVK